MSILSFDTNPRLLRWGGLACIVLATVGLFFAFRSGPAATRPAPTALPVRVASVEVRNVPEYLNGLGTVIPSQTSLVRSRVDGNLLRLHFEDGQNVKAGDLLAEIDPRPFEMALNDAKGQLARDKAILDNARLDLHRYEGLRDKDYVSAQQLETQKSTVRQYEGIVASDKAKVDDAALNLEYSRVTAPMSGRLGLRQVDAGNMIRASDSAGIIRITQMEPAYVVFTLPESQLPLVLEGLRGPAATGPLVVDVWDREYKKQLTSGFLLTLDNQIDTTTGTIKLKAEFSNTDGQLFPNQFVNAQLLVRTLHAALVVPSSAIQRGPQGAFVYVVTADNKATVCPVQTGWSTNTITVIDTGLQAGDRVVVDGLDRLRNGMAVSVVQETGTTPAPPSKP